MVFETRIYDSNWKLLDVNYRQYDDREQAELRAEFDRDWLDSEGHFEIIRIR